MDDNTELRLTAEQEAWRREIEAIKVDALVHFARASGILPDDEFKAAVIIALRKPPMNKRGGIDQAALNRALARAFPEKKAAWVDAITLLRQVSKRAESAIDRDERTNPRPPGWGTDDYNAAFDYFLSKMYEAYAELLSVPDGKTQSGVPSLTRLEQLTDRQREVAELLASGLRRPEIAQKLMISPSTVKTHMEDIRDALGLDTARQDVLADAVRKLLGGSGGG